MSHLVSVITPIYNSERYLSECIESVQKQSYTNFEHILIDDCSTDNSVGIAKKFAKKDSRIRLLKLKKNGGAGVARNKGIDMAKGRYIAFLDSDDFWHKDKLEKQLRLMNNNKVAVVYSQYYLYDEQIKKVTHLIKSPYRTDFNKMQKNDYIGFLTLMIDTDKVGKLLMPTIRRRQDWAYKLLILKQGFEAYCVAQPLGYYRIGNKSLSSNKLKLVKYNFGVYRNVLGFSFLKSIYKMGLFFAFHFIFKLISKKKLNK